MKISTTVQPLMADPIVDEFISHISKNDGSLEVTNDLIARLCPNQNLDKFEQKALSSFLGTIAVLSTKGQLKSV